MWLYFIEDLVLLIFVLYREVSRQMILKFTTNIFFHALTIKSVEPYYFSY